MYVVVGPSTSSLEYGGAMMLPGWIITGGGEIAPPVAGHLWGAVAVSYFRVGGGHFLEGTTWISPTMQPSNVITAMVGLKVASHDRARSGPFISGSAGIGRIAIGDM